MLLGMNAHINFDLPQSLVRDDPAGGLRRPRALRDLRRRDHERIDGVLAARVADEDVALAARRRPPDPAGPGARAGQPHAPAGCSCGSRGARCGPTPARCTRRGCGAPPTTPLCLADLEAASAARVADLLRPGPVLLRLAVHGFGGTPARGRDGDSAVQSRASAAAPVRTVDRERGRARHVSAELGRADPVGDEPAEARRRRRTIATSGSSAAMHPRSPRATSQVPPAGPGEHQVHVDRRRARPPPGPRRSGRRLDGEIGHQPQRRPGPARSPAARHAPDVVLVGPQLERPDDQQRAQRQPHPVHRDDGVEVRAAAPRASVRSDGGAPLPPGVRRRPPRLPLGGRLRRPDVVGAGDVRIARQRPLHVVLHPGQVPDQALDVEVAQDRDAPGVGRRGRPADRRTRPRPGRTPRRAEMAGTSGSGAAGGAGAAGSRQDAVAQARRAAAPARSRRLQQLVVQHGLELGEGQAHARLRRPLGDAHPPRDVAVAQPAEVGQFDGPALVRRQPCAPRPARPRRRRRPRPPRRGTAVAGTGSRRACRSSRPARRSSLRRTSSARCRAHRVR